MPNAVRMAGVTTLANLASAISARAEEASIVAELKAGSENAYEWLIAHYHQPVYGLVYRILNDSADAADTTQEVFLKVFRGIKRFNGEASLRTWIYRIALHEASNQRRWWNRHKKQELTIDAPLQNDEGECTCLAEMLATGDASPYEQAAQTETRQRVEAALRLLPDAYREVVVLREIEGFG